MDEFKNRHCIYGCETDYSSKVFQNCPGCGSSLYIENESPVEKKERERVAEIERINTANAEKIIQLNEETDHGTTTSDSGDDTSHTG